MTPPLFLLDPLPVGDRLVLDGPEGRHAVRVKRIGPGESVLVSDGRGTVATCTVESAGGERLELRVLSRRVVEPRRPRLVVVQALPKTDRADLTVELLTELGADEIVPWAAARSIAQWRDERGSKALARWRRTAAEAAKRCRRARVPEIGELARTTDVASRVARAGGALVLHEAAADRLTAASLPQDGELLLVIGPEGGVAGPELDELAAAGARPVRLGDEVLRTSTAGAAALAALSVRLGRW